MLRALSIGHGAWVPTLRSPDSRYAGPGSLRPGRQRQLSESRIEYFEAGRAFEGAWAIFAGHGIVVALPGLAQKPRLHHQVALRRRLLAALLDEDAADRRLAVGRRKIRAAPSVRLVAIDHGKAQHMRHAPLMRRRARIGDEAQPAQHAVAVEQRR